MYQFLVLSALDRNVILGQELRYTKILGIGERTLIGLGSNVISDIEKETMAVGNPARAIRKCFS